MTAADDEINWLNAELIRRDLELTCLREALRESEGAVRRLTRSLDDHRENALKLGDYERPAVIAEILARNLRGWPRARWQALADRLRDRFEIRP